MKKIFLLFIYMSVSFTCFSQVGIGTKTPAGTLEVTSGDEKKLGLVVPIVAKLENVKNAITGEIVKQGTIVFDEQRNTICYKTSNNWTCMNGIVVPDVTPSPRPLSSTVKGKS